MPPHSYYNRSCLAQSCWALFLCLAMWTGCDSQSAIVLSIRPPAGVTLAEYAVQLEERQSRTLVYQSGVQPVDAVAQGRDLSSQPLRIGLKLSQGGTYLVHVRAATGKLAQGGTVPNPRMPEYFFADLVTANGTVDVNGELLEVQPQFDQDFDHFPDAMTWPAALAAAQDRYGGHLELLDCVDRDPGAGQTPLPAPYTAVQFNPLAKPVCGLPIDLSCAAKAPACTDKDGDGESEATDCDDSDAKRFHGNARPRNCCQCSDPKSCANNHSKLTNPALCQPSRCDSSFDYDCTGRVVPCFVDDDCDGFSPNDPVPALRDCDDTSSDVYPGAPKKCGDPSHDWACDGAPQAGCVDCDLDGDGFQRSDPANGCPTATNSGPIDCNDNDRGVFPGSTLKRFEGATLLVHDLDSVKAQEGGGKVAAALRGLCRNTAPAFPMFAATADPQDADCDGIPRNGCPPAQNGANQPCDVDGDGFPNANANCNPQNLPIDCNDNNGQIFPGAPEKCGDGTAQGCGQDVACTNDSDKDGYTADYDCDDTNAAIHPFAKELCNGIDDDCDGLVDEQNPDAAGNPLIRTYTVGASSFVGITTCADDDEGECGRTDPTTGALSGRCVCSGRIPNSSIDPAHHVNGCPGTTATGISPRCFGAIQPQPQTCDADNPRDDDCNGVSDDKTGANLAEKISGAPCGITQGQCRPGLVVGCDRSKPNAFAGLPNFPSKDRFLVCDSAAQGPQPEVCDSQDNNCNLQTDETCTLGAGAAPSCCGLMCIDTLSDPLHCGGCNRACTNAADRCSFGVCRCGGGAVCSGATPLCSGGTCVQCLTTADCASLPGTVCDGTSHRCTACTATDTSACPAGRKSCDTSGGTNVCVECVNDTACTNPALPACNTATRTCVTCTTGNVSACPAGQKHCDTATPGGACVSCLVNSDCPSMACNTTTHTCVGCTSDTQCAPMRCDLNTNACVQCNANADCSSPQSCVNHACIECIMDAQCTTPGRTRCDLTTNTCVECAFDSQCPSAKPNCVGSSCVECRTSGDCNATSSAPICRSGTCGSCSGAADCAGNANGSVCMTGGACGCTSNSDCGGSQPICSGGVCRRCASGSECQARSASTPICNALVGNCEGCTISAQCGGNPSGNICSSGICGCASSADCSVTAAPVCSSSACRACAAGATGDGECAAKNASTPVCMSGACVKCTSNSQCASGHCELLSGACAQCLVDADCPQASATPVCSGLTCVACSSNADCAGSSSGPACATSGTNAGKCVPCTADSQCMDPTKSRCDTAINTCVACTAPGQCARFAATPQCNTTGTGPSGCVQCVDNSPCAAAKQVCDIGSSGTYACRPCSGDSECGANVCVVGKCVGCRDAANCGGATPICDSTSLSCRACTGNAECAARSANTPICSGGQCVPCTSNGDCATSPAGNRCLSGRCVPCLSNADCNFAAAQPSCDPSDGLCKPCTATGLDCSGSTFGTMCDAMSGQCM